jgi:predicted amidohydrolase YtcJ
LAGVGRDTPDPHGGRIERDSQTGEPSGTLREWSAMDLVEKRLPPTTTAEQINGVRSFLREAARLGITAAHDAMVSPEQLAVYAHLEKQGELTVRVGVSLL